MIRNGQPRLCREAGNNREVAADGDQQQQGTGKTMQQHGSGDNRQSRSAVARSSMDDAPQTESQSAAFGSWCAVVLFTVTMTVTCEGLTVYGYCYTKIETL
jgi:hypothetical protein